MSLIEQFSELGMEQISFGLPGMSGYARLETGKPAVLGISEPLESHLALLTRCPWYQGPLMLLSGDGPPFILWDQFFCLETPDFPKDLLELRDHFDYALELDIQERFPDVRPMFGPAWRYIFPCEAFEENLRASSLRLAAPLIGNAVNCRSENAASLLATGKMIRSYMADKLPLPMIWAFPQDLPIGPKDSFYDVKSGGWYIAEVKSDFVGSISLVDLRPDEDGVCRSMQHDFQGNIKEVEVRSRDIVVEFKAVKGKFRSRRKLSRLKLSHLW